MYAGFCERSFTGKGVPVAVMRTVFRLSPALSMTLPVELMSVERFLTVTVAPSASGVSRVGLTSNPGVALRVMSPVRFSALTVNEPVSPVPLMVSSSVDVVSEAKGGANAPVVS